MWKNIAAKKKDNECIVMNIYIFVFVAFFTEGDKKAGIIFVFNIFIIGTVFLV